MADQDPNTKTWIVLINRVPSGPYHAAEITAFLEKHLLRTTDLGYVVSDDPKAPHEWKFLWQFAEFERRKEPAPGTDLPAGGVPRQALSPEQLRGKVLSQIPEELHGASREDIVRKSRRDIKIPSADGPSSGLKIARWMRYAIPVAAVAGLAYFAIPFLKQATIKAKEVAPPSASVPAQAPNPAAAVPAGAGGTSSPETVVGNSPPSRRAFEPHSPAAGAAAAVAEPMPAAPPPIAPDEAYQGNVPQVADPFAVEPMHIRRAPREGENSDENRDPAAEVAGDEPVPDAQ